MVRWTDSPTEADAVRIAPSSWLDDSIAKGRSDVTRRISRVRFAPGQGSAAVVEAGHVVSKGAEVKGVSCRRSSAMQCW